MWTADRVQMRQLQERARGGGTAGGQPMKKTTTTPPTSLQAEVSGAGECWRGASHGAPALCQTLPKASSEYVHSSDLTAHRTAHNLSGRCTDDSAQRAAGFASGRRARADVLRVPSCVVRRDGRLRQRQLQERRVVPLRVRRADRAARRGQVVLCCMLSGAAAIDCAHDSFCGVIRRAPSPGQWASGALWCWTSARRPGWIPMRCSTAVNRGRCSLRSFET